MNLRLAYYATVAVLFGSLIGSQVAVAWYLRVLGYTFSAIVPAVDVVITIAAYGLIVWQIAHPEVLHPREASMDSRQQRWCEVAALQEAHIENGPPCRCTHARTRHRGMLKTPRLSGYDGPCADPDCDCPTYTPLGISYKELSDREFAAEQAVLFPTAGPQ